MAYERPTFPVIWVDDIEISNLRCGSNGLMSLRIPNSEQSFTAGGPALVDGQCGSPTGYRRRDPHMELPRRHEPATFSVDQAVENPENSPVQD